MIFNMSIRGMHELEHVPLERSNTMLKDGVVLHYLCQNSIGAWKTPPHCHPDAPPHVPTCARDVVHSIGDATRYLEVGVSATKADVYSAIRTLPAGISKRTFCKVLPDVFAGDDNFLAACHSDGAGSKSLLA